MQQEKSNIRLNERLAASRELLKELFRKLYAGHQYEEQEFEQLVNIIKRAFDQRPEVLKKRDLEKQSGEINPWFLLHSLCGMSLYVDRFCGTLEKVNDHLDYLQSLGVNLVHLMPLFQSPEGESDGGYAVSDFRKIDSRFGTLDDLLRLQKNLQDRDMYLMLDIVLNHTSHHHEWARRARAGEKKYQEFYYFFKDRSIPDEFEKGMPEVFPESSPGNFTWIPESEQWVMTVFHHYQWDLNFSNPAVLCAMLENIFFYANMGVDVLRIDAPAFIWKKPGTTCQNLPEAHLILQIIKQAVQIAAPGMALLGEAIVAPSELMNYFGTDKMKGKECDLAYNATQMALQWDALATADTRVMLAAQHELSKKPRGTSWITYTRCHDDIGLGYEDEMIRFAGYDAYAHRTFLKNFYTGHYPGSPARGTLFGVNEKTGDARISGTLASLCGLEQALLENDDSVIENAICRMILMQAMSFFIGGIPMIFYGDEAGYLNDYTFITDPGKQYDNRWMHRPLINWSKNELTRVDGTIENKIFTSTKKLLDIRKNLNAFADTGNLYWLNTDNNHVAGFIRTDEMNPVCCLFNFKDKQNAIPWQCLNSKGKLPEKFFEHWNKETVIPERESEMMNLESYQFKILTAV